MKILILTLADAPLKEVAKISKPNKEKFAKKHGHAFFQFDHLLDPSRHTSWNKIVAIKRMLTSEFAPEWIFWTDADSLVTNDSVRLEDFIEAAGPSKSLIIAKDGNCINSGQFLIKRSYWSLRMLDVVYQNRQYATHPRHEQMAIESFLKSPIQESAVEYAPRLASFVGPVDKRKKGKI